MVNIEEINKYLKENLTEYRYDHVMRVCDMAMDLGKIYGLDLMKVKISALLHDCAKDIDKEDLIRISRENGLLNEMDYDYKSILHSAVGAFIAKSKFNVYDEDILNGILYHTTGRANMSTFEKVIFVSDKIEKGRDFKGVLELRKMAITDLDETIVMYFNIELTRIISKNKCIHPKSVECRNFYILSKIKKGELDD